MAEPTARSASPFLNGRTTVIAARGASAVRTLLQSESGKVVTAEPKASQQPEQSNQPSSAQPSIFSKLFARSQENTSPQTSPPPVAEAKEDMASFM